MIRAEVPVAVIEGDDPLITLKIMQTTDGVSTPFDFTGVTAVEFIIKPSITSETPLHTYTMAGGAVNLISPIATTGKLTVQIMSADVGAVSNKRYKLRVQRASKWDTLMAGQFIVKDV